MKENSNIYLCFFKPAQLVKGDYSNWGFACRRDAACQTELSMIDQAIDLIRDTANAIPNVIK